MSLGEELRTRLHELGAALVGYADLAVLPPAQRSGLSRGIAIAVVLDRDVVAALGHGPTPAYHAEYRRANAALEMLARHASGWLRARGFAATSAAATVRVVSAGNDTTPLPHKTIATLAGLGWIGHSALLVTREHGAAIRLGSVLTDAPLEPGTPVTSSECGRCRRCVEACPARAISGRAWSPGLARASFYDADACREAATELAASQSIDETICGICIRACPFTQRWLHRASRPGGANAGGCVDNGRGTGYR